MTNLAEQFERTSGPAGEVRIAGATVTANVMFSDAEIAEILTQVPEVRRVDFVVRATRSGVLAMGSDITTRMRESLRFMQTTLDTHVTSFGERMVEKVAEQLGDADKDGHVQRRVQELLARAAVDLKASIEKALPEAFDGQTKMSVERIQAEGDRVMKEMVALFSENGLAWQVIHDAKREFASRLEEVKVAMTVAQTKAANPTPREAGLDYESWIHRQLALIASLRGDEVEFTGKTAGQIVRCMKGDTRMVLAAEGVEVTMPPCLAVEIRDREDSEFTLSDVEMMMTNRGAHVAVVVAAHTGSMPKQCSDRSFAVSRRKRLVTVVIDPDSTDSEVLLAAAYDVAAALAIESVRRSRDGDWDEVARRVEAVEQAVEGVIEARAAFDSIEKKAHEGSAAAAKRHALLVRLVGDLAATVRAQ
jgi:hypothetical protein